MSQGLVNTGTGDGLLPYVNHQAINWTKVHESFWHSSQANVYLNILDGMF